MAAMGLRQIEKVGGGFLCAKQGGFQSPAVSARQWWWSLFPAAGEEIGNSCGLLLDPGTASSSAGAGNRTLCVPKPARHWPCPCALWSVGLWAVPVTANSPPGKALSVVKGPLPPSSISRAPSTRGLPRTAPSTSLWIMSSPSSPTASWRAQPSKSGDLGTPGAQRQQGAHGTPMEWGPCAWGSETEAEPAWLGKAQTNHGRCSCISMEFLPQGTPHGLLVPPKLERAAEFISSVPAAL